MNIEVVPYDKQWITNYNSIKQVISKSLNNLIIDIEHVGSTSVPGLAAKPILDIDIVIENYDVFPEVNHMLQKIGYLHQKEWSFEGREAFGRIDKLAPWNGKGTQWMTHHLYVCDKDSEELSRHIAFREYLRYNREAAIEYESIKKNLNITAKNRNAYTLGKNEFINNILKEVFGGRA
jgi:GrpB-like predicted nucleotidyltransferase (UPF0157 family)